jgi:hypothetical protein
VTAGQKSGVRRQKSEDILTQHAFGALVPQLYSLSGFGLWLTAESWELTAQRIHDAALFRKGAISFQQSAFRFCG